jgi:hypothetical protein
MKPASVCGLFSSEETTVTDVTYHGGPFDGYTHHVPKVTPLVERLVGVLDVTPEDVLTPTRKVEVTARYEWSAVGPWLDFVGLRATYREEHL